MDKTRNMFRPKKSIRRWLTFPLTLLVRGSCSNKELCNRVATLWNSSLQLSSLQNWNPNNVFLCKSLIRIMLQEIKQKGKFFKKDLSIGFSILYFQTYRLRPRTITGSFCSDQEIIRKGLSNFKPKLMLFVLFSVV